ncbi:MAG: PstS family phosphate ABC transporter substrate-binding protein [Opitutales bacterium]
MSTDHGIRGGEELGRFRPPSSGCTPDWMAAVLLGVALVLRAWAGVESVQAGALPVYAPARPESGVIRIHDTELTQHLVHLWQDGFLRLHPPLRYLEYTVPTWFSGLCAGTADVAVTGHEAWRSDLKAFEGIYGYPPLEIMFATGGFDRRKGNTPGVIVFVHKDNPLTKLTLQQLDGIFGAQRTGGWRGTHWTADAARGPEGNLRTWDQLGLTGEWAGRPIHPYGIDATLSGWSGLMQHVVFGGADKWNPALKEIVRGGTEVPADAQIVAGVAADPDGIGFSFMRVVEENPGVRPLALSAGAAGPFVPPTAETFQQRTYPLVNAVYLYVNRAPGRPLPPRLREFLLYVLSRQGQQAVAEDGMYLPLPEAIAAEQRRKLD